MARWAIATLIVCGISGSAMAKDRVQPQFAAPPCCTDLTPGGRQPFPGMVIASTDVSHVTVANSVLRQVLIDKALGLEAQAKQLRDAAAVIGTN